MIASDPTEAAKRFDHLLGNERVAEVARAGLGELRKLFGSRRARGVEMAVRALSGVRDAGGIEALAPAFIAQLPTS